MKKFTFWRIGIFLLIAAAAVILALGFLGRKNISCGDYDYISSVKSKAKPKARLSALLMATRGRADISFEMKAYALSGDHNIFQSASGKYSIGVELNKQAALDLVVGSRHSSEKFRRVHILEKILLDKWYKIRIVVQKGYGTKVFVDSELLADVYDEHTYFKFSHLDIGDVFNKSGPFPGAVKNIHISLSPVPSVYLAFIISVYFLLLLGIAVWALYRRRNNSRYQVCLIFTAAVLAALAFFSQDAILTKYKRELKDINYDSASPNPKLKSAPEFYENRDYPIKETTIRFKAKIHSVVGWDNLFQTAPVNFGLRMELNKTKLGLIIGDAGPNGFTGINILPQVQMDKWYDFCIKAGWDQRIQVSIDGVNVYDRVIEKMCYDLSHIAVGTGFSQTRPFYGEIKDFEIKYRCFIVPPGMVYFLTRIFVVLVLLMSGVFLRRYFFALITAAKKATLRFHSDAVALVGFKRALLNKIFIGLNVLFIVMLVLYSRERIQYTADKVFEYSGGDYNSAVAGQRPVDAGGFIKKKGFLLGDIDASCFFTPGTVSQGDIIFQIGRGDSGMKLNVGDDKHPQGMFLTLGNGRSYKIFDVLNPGSEFLVRIKKTNKNFFDKHGRLQIWINNTSFVDTIEDSYVDVPGVVIGSAPGKAGFLNGRVRGFTLKVQHIPYTITQIVVAGILAVLGFLLALFFVYAAAAGMPFAKTFSLSVTAGLTIFSVYKIIKDPYFLSAIHPLTFKYLGMALLSLGALLILLDKRFQKGFLVIFAVPLMIILSGEALALFGLILFCAAGLGLGLLVYRLFDNSTEIDSKKIVFSLFLGISADSYLMWVLTHFKVNYPVVYYAIFGTQILLMAKILSANFAAMRGKLLRYDFTLAQKFLAFLMAVQVVYALVPNYSCDELVAHLYMPKVISLKGFFPYSPHYTSSFFNESITVIGSHASLFLTGGEYAIRLFYLFLLYLALFLMESCIRKNYNKRISFFAVMTLALTPYFLQNFGCLFVDHLGLLSSAIIFVQFLFTMANFNKKNILLSFLFITFGLMAKQTDIFLVLPAAVALAWRIIRVAIRTKDYSYFKPFIIGCAMVFIVFAPLLIRNMVMTGNPTFPLYNNIFKSSYYPTSLPLPGFFKFTGAGLNWNSLYDITFEGDKYYVYGNNQFVFGITYFVIFLFFFSLFLYKEKRKEVLSAVFLFFGAIFCCYYSTGPQLRYFIVSAPMGALLAGLIMNNIWEVNRGDKLSRYLLWSIFAAVFAVNFICQINNTYLPGPYPVVEAMTHNYEKSGRLKHFEQVKKFFKEVGKKYGHRKALLFYAQEMYFADFDIEMLDWYNQLTAMEILDHWTTLDDAYDRIFHKQKFGLLILTDSRPATFLDDFVDKGLVRKDYSRDGYSVYLPAHEVK